MTLRKSASFVVLSWVVVFAWALFIFYASANTASNLNDGRSLFALAYQALQDLQIQLLGSDVDAIHPVAHFCEYAVFGVLWANVLRCYMPLPQACLLAIICASLYGITDEFHQLFVPGRMCDPLDWLVDTAGASVGSYLAFFALRHKSQV